jgi:hypothetical protein
MQRQILHAVILPLNKAWVLPNHLASSTFSNADELNSTKLPNSYVSGVIIDSCNLFGQPGAFIHPLKQISNSVERQIDSYLNHPFNSLSILID